MPSAAHSLADPDARFPGRLRPDGGHVVLASAAAGVCGVDGASLLADIAAGADRSTGGVAFLAGARGERRRRARDGPSVATPAKRWRCWCDWTVGPGGRAAGTPIRPAPR